MKTTSVPLIAAALVVSAAIPGGPLHAQGPDTGNGVRLGVAVGGISTVGVNVEFFRDSRSIDLQLGTWSFRDLSFSVVGRQYFGASAAQPFVGVGLWLVTAAPGDGRTGLAAVLRAPIGVDWEVTERHALGAALNVNRGLWVRRSDPEDDLPMNKRLVPLPELYYRYTR